MAHKYEEVISVKVPRGTREELHRIADRRYVAVSTVVRVAIMQFIEEERRTKAAA